MASRGHVEHDFLGVDNPANHHHHPSSSSHPRLDRRQSFRGISKINPEIVKSVMASAAKADNAAGPPVFPQLPVYRPLPFFRASNDTVTENEHEKGKAKQDSQSEPMTIFYNGSVSVFDLPKEKAECIINYVMEKTTSVNESDNQVDQPSLSAQNDITLDSLIDGDLPIKRKKSLQRFFEKRKERLISVSPYPHIDNVSILHHKTSG